MDSAGYEYENNGVDCLNWTNHFGDFYIFPDDVAVSQLYKQAGNSVSVPLIQRLAEFVKEETEIFALDSFGFYADDIKNNVTNHDSHYLGK